MHIITERVFTEAAALYPNDAQALFEILKTLKRARFTSPDDMRRVFSSLDRMKYREKWWVIDVGGKNLRIMFYANFVNGRIFVKHIATHAEYDKLIKYYREHNE